MGGVYGQINSRADFGVLLQKATREGELLLRRRPGDPVIEVIERQLEAVGAWSANGRTPTKAERGSIDIALRASRELEGDSDACNWTRDLYALDAYIEDWPSDDHAANATDEDFFNSDEDEPEDE